MAIIGSNSSEYSWRVPRSRSGTEGSNPAPSSAESATNSPPAVFRARLGTLRAMLMFGAFSKRYWLQIKRLEALPDAREPISPVRHGRQHPRISYCPRSLYQGWELPGTLTRNV